jgi:hypothetical protein
MPKTHWELKEESDCLYALSGKYFGLMWSCTGLLIVEILANYFHWLSWWITVPVIALAFVGMVVGVVKAKSLDEEAEYLEERSGWALSDSQMDVGIRYDQRRGASLPKAQRELQDLEMERWREQRAVRGNMRTGRR